MVAGAEPYGNMKDAALAVKGERIAWIGPAAEGARKAAELAIPARDVRGLWMTPGLIDCHTHLVYGGNRVEEFEKRLCGASSGAARFRRSARPAPDERGGHHHRNQIRLRPRTRGRTATARSGAGFGGRAARNDQKDLFGTACAST